MARKAKDKGNTNGASAGDLPGNEKSGSNLTDATINTCVEAVEAAKADLKKAQQEVSRLQGIYRAKVKNFKSCGGNTEALALYLRKKEMDPDEAAMVLAQELRIAKVRNAPYGTQFSLMDDLAKPKPYDAGYAAARNGEPRDNNEYQAGTAEHADWDRGFCQWAVDHAPAPMGGAEMRQ